MLARTGLLAAEEAWRVEVRGREASSQEEAGVEEETDPKPTEKELCMMSYGHYGIVWYVRNAPPLRRGSKADSELVGALG